MRARLTRREFLQTGATTSAATACGATSTVEAAARARSSPPSAASSIDLVVNDIPRRLLVEPRTTLAEALRGALGLTGTKIACNRGACSACTVWLDGEPVCSCMLLAFDVAGRRVTTIEGLARGDALHPVQAAFIKHDAMQCGFCTPGLAMSCAALLARRPSPVAADVEAAISGHLCRCGAYPHVVEATLAAAKATKG